MSKIIRIFAATKIHKIMQSYYDILQSISQGEDGTLSPEDARLVQCSRRMGDYQQLLEQNNLLHANGSIVCALVRYLIHNIIFPDTAYTFVGFTGFPNRSIYPIVRQQYIKNGTPVLQNEIDCYMSAIGFTKWGTGKFFNTDFTLSDILPKNVLKDPSGDIFVIDAEIKPR